MLFFIYIMKIYMKEEFDFLTTHNPLRPLRLCVGKFKYSFNRSIILIHLFRYSGN
jgi:hypothetical protein